jgi:hypothetical protein
MKTSPIHTHKPTAGQNALRIAERLRAAGRNVRVIYRREGKRA